MSILLIYKKNLVNKNLKDSIDWKVLNIEKILAASDFSQLKKNFIDYNIKIMLFDINVSQKSEILKWIKSNYSDVKIILSVSEAKYKATKDILGFNSYDYIIKPLTKEKLENKLSKHFSFSHFWLNYKPNIVEKFWFNILGKENSSDKQSIEKEASLKNIPNTKDIKILPLILGIHRWHNKPKKSDETIMEFGLKNIGEEIIAKDAQYGKFYQIKPGFLLGIISLDLINKSELLNFDETCKKYIDICREYFECDLSCYIGNKIYIYELQNTVNELFKLKEKNKAFINKVISLEAQSNKNGNIDLENMNTWLLMLRKGLGKKVIKQIKIHLEKLNSIKKLDLNMLYKFQHDFIEIIYFELEQKGIEPNKLFSDEKSLKLHMYASNSISDMMKWIVYTVEKAISYINETPSKKSKKPHRNKL